MNRFVPKFLIVLIFIFLCVVSSFSQIDKENKPDFSVFGFGSEKQIVYAKKNDGLPKKIDAKGTIVDANVSGIYRGILATGGTLKIKLDEKIKNYDDNFLYVIVLCLAGKENENLIGKNIEIKVKKLTEFPYKFGVSLSNSINSNGTPFYLSTVEGVGGLFKQLENKSKK